LGAKLERLRRPGHLIQPLQSYQPNLHFPMFNSLILLLEVLLMYHDPCRLLSPFLPSVISSCKRSSMPLSHVEGQGCLPEQVFSKLKPKIPAEYIHHLVWAINRCTGAGQYSPCAGVPKVHTNSYAQADCLSTASRSTLDVQAAFGHTADGTSIVA
jgi:hypothetical protein